MEKMVGNEKIVRYFFAVARSIFSENRAGIAREGRLAKEMPLNLNRESERAVVVDEAA